MTFNRKRLILAVVCGGLGFLAVGIIVPAVTFTYPSTNWATQSLVYLAIGLFPLGFGTGAYFFMGKMRPPLEGECQKCGFDLTGNESGVCPECGREVEA